jgi:hypothetical protein
MSVMPSKVQRQKAALRDEARNCALRVSMRPLPTIPARFRFTPDGELACYERRLPAGMQPPGSSEDFVYAGEAWSPTKGVAPAPEWLTDLPSGAVFVALSEHTVSIFWDEKEGSEGLLKIKQAIDLIE